MVANLTILVKGEYGTQHQSCNAIKGSSYNFHNKLANSHDYYALKDRQCSFQSLLNHASNLWNTEL